jgi:lipoyl(octanoyl) transferase
VPGPAAIPPAIELAFDRTRVLPFGRRAPADYEPVRALQERLLEERVAGRTPDLILVGEHARVVTLGRGVKGPPPSLPIPVVPIERGGQATWHGPGQLVAYPIVSLADLRLSIRDYLRALEDALLATLAAFGLDGRRVEGATGAWVGERKVASIGVAVRRRCTWHGVALNVAPDLSDFALIEPCGFSPKVMSSMAELLGSEPALREVEARLVRELVRALRLAPPIWEHEVGG